MAKQIKSISMPDLKQPLTPALLGKAIRARRTQSNLRLEDAAAFCNVAKQTLQDVEHGLGKSKFDTVLQICNGLGIKLHIRPWIQNSGDDNDWQ